MNISTPGRVVIKNPLALTAAATPLLSNNTFDCSHPNIPNTTYGVPAAGDASAQHTPLRSEAAGNCTYDTNAPPGIHSGDIPKVNETFDMKGRGDAPTASATFNMPSPSSDQQPVTANQTFDVQDIASQAPSSSTFHLPSSSSDTAASTAGPANSTFNLPSNEPVATPACNKTFDTKPVNIEAVVADRSPVAGDGNVTFDTVSAQTNPTLPAVEDNANNNNNDTFNLPPPQQQEPTTNDVLNTTQTLSSSSSSTNASKAPQSSISKPASGLKPGMLQRCKCFIYLH